MVLFDYLDRHGFRQSSESQAVRSSMVRCNCVRIRCLVLSSVGWERVEARNECDCLEGIRTALKKAESIGCRFAVHSVPTEYHFPVDLLSARGRQWLLVNPHVKNRRPFLRYLQRLPHWIPRPMMKQQATCLSQKFAVRRTKLGLICAVERDFV